MKQNIKKAVKKPARVRPRTIDSASVGVSYWIHVLAAYRELRTVKALREVGTAISMSQLEERMYAVRMHLAASQEIRHVFAWRHLREQIKRVVRDNPNGTLREWALAFGDDGGEGL